MLQSRVAVALSVSQTLPSGMFILRAISRRSLLAIKFRAYFTSSISPGFRVLLNHGSSGP